MLIAEFRELATVLLWQYCVEYCYYGNCISTTEQRQMSIVGSAASSCTLQSGEKVRTGRNTFFDFYFIKFYTILHSSS